MAVPRAIAGVLGCFGNFKSYRKTEGLTCSRTTCQEVAEQGTLSFAPYTIGELGQIFGNCFSTVSFASVDTPGQCKIKSMLLQPGDG